MKLRKINSIQGRRIFQNWRIVNSINVMFLVVKEKCPNKTFRVLHTGLISHKPSFPVETMIKKQEKD